MSLPLTPHEATLPRRLLDFLRANVVAVLSSVAALASLAFVPAEGWWRAIDLRTLNLLFCLMFVVAGLRECNLFRVTAQALLAGRTRYRALAHALVWLTFLLSMLVTNDVALIVLVPFGVYVLDRLGLRRRLLGLVALQTVAANLGSMATPIGNPQNLFLYTAHAIPAVRFFAAMLPIVLAGGLLLALFLQAQRDEPIAVTFAHRRTLTHPRKVALYAALFLLCLLTVFRLFPEGALFALVLAAALLFSRRVLATVDYGLLLTFVCFFVFSHNVGSVGPLRDLLSRLLEDHTQATAAVASQFLSNVPAAVLLSPFTDDWRGLLWGADIGGFGTPVASLASLISLGLYCREPDARPWAYLLLFSLLNLAFLAVLTVLTLLL